MTAFDPDRITFFARTNARGQNVPFGIKAKDRQRHMYVIGKTGMGKSTLLENMAAQDIKNGEGMAFIDPHGSAIETLLEYVPEERLDDVVYFAPFDMEHPISFNIMEDVGADKRHLVVSGLMSTFKKIWVDAWSARMEYILTNALLALIEYPDTTLLSVNRMLADKSYRDKVVDHIKDPAVKAYWVDEFANYTERFAAEALPAIQNKIGQFTGNPLIRNIIGQPKSSFDVRKMMDEKKILLVNLSKGLVGETNADLLGSMLITKIYLAAMSRAELPPAQMKQMPNFYFYVDEFQSFANSTFSNILSEARKYHLNLIIAHQYVEQMEEEVRNAVFGNVGTTVAFRVGPFDAETLEPIFQPQFMANDLVNLGFAQIYLTLMIDGVGSSPFSAQTLPPVPTPEKSHKYMVIKRSQQNFCKPRTEVEKIVTDLHTPDDRAEASQKGEGGNKGGFTKPSAFFKVGTDKKFAAQKDQNRNGKNFREKDKSTNYKNEKKSRDEAPKKTGQRTEKKDVNTAQKTPDELRAILAKMASKEKDKNAKEKPNTNTNDSKKVVVGDSNHKASLQAALAGIVPAENEKKDAVTVVKENHNQAPVKKEKNRVTKSPESIKVKSERKPETPRPDDAIAALKAHFGGDKKESEQPGEVVTQSDPKNEVTHIANEIAKLEKTERKVVENREEDLLEKVFTPRSIHSKKDVGYEKSSISKVVVERRPQIPVQMQKSSQQEVVSDKPAFTVSQSNDEPDLKTVKKMLRHTGNDRIPGMS